jgi:arylsulfatase A-like enzyme
VIIGAMGMLVAAAGVLCAAEPQTDEGSASRRPSFLLLLADDLRFDALGCQGNQHIKTPHIDRLAEGGTRFTQSFCTTSICMISRASLITGQYASRHGIVGFSAPISRRAWPTTFPAILKKAGYRLGFIGKWGLGEPMPKDEYDYWRGFPGQGRYFQPGDDEHLTDKQAAQALEFLDGCEPAKPFCLQLSFKAAHCQDGEPWQTQFPPANRYLSLYADVTLPVPETATVEDFARLPAMLQTSEARRRFAFRFADAEMTQYTLRNYYRLVTGINDAIGQIVGKLKERGLADNTIVIFTADNGFYLGDRGLAGKWFMHEESIRVPLVVFDPRRMDNSARRTDEATIRGVTCDALALNIDIAPTILDFAGLGPPDTMQGRSLAPLLRGQRPANWPDTFFYEHRFVHKAIPQTVGVRSPKWKYARYFTDTESVEQLFDLSGDPLERTDLAANPRHASELEKWRKACEEWMEKVK